jgi:hypothetical protein
MPEAMKKSGAAAKAAAPAAPAVPAPAPTPPKVEVKPEPKTEAPAPKAEASAAPKAPARATREESKPKPPPPPKETAPPKRSVSAPIELPGTEIVGRRGPLAPLGIGAPVYGFTEGAPESATAPPAAPDVADLWMMRPHIEAIRRVEQLRSEGKIGPQVQTLSGTATTMRYPAAQPKAVVSKLGRPAQMRAPRPEDIERPTAQELDVPVLGAQKLVRVIGERNALRREAAERQKSILGLEAELAAARSPATIDPTQSRAAQMEARAQRMGEISDKLREMAAKQRALTTQMAAKEATMREYGMTEEEINPQ